MVFFRTAAFLWLVAASPAYTDVTLFGAAATTQIENIGALSQHQRAGLEEFANEKTYFGAIFFEQGGSGWGYYKGAHHIKDAIDFAQRICQSYSSGGECELAGVLYPADLDTKNIPSNTLSKRASEKYRIYSSRDEGYRAFAKSSNGSFGWATRHDTPEAATEAALTYCFSSSMKDLLELEVDLRIKALEDELYNCRIIDSAGPHADPS